MSHLQQLFELTSTLTKFAEDNERIGLPVFSLKLGQAHASFPEDHTIGMMSMVIAKMANNNKLSISRAELRDLYQRFYSRNSKFASLFSEELGASTEVESKPVAKQSNAIVDLIQAADTSDTVLAGALDQAWGEPNRFEAKMASAATDACVGAFKNLGLRVQASVIAQQDGVMICAVGFETPRGTTSVLVPVEITAGRTVDPVVFVGNAGSCDITKSNIIEYVTKCAGDKLLINARELLDAALLAKQGEQTVSDVDLALIRLNAVDDAIAISAPSVLGVEMPDPNPNVMREVPVVRDEHFESIARTFDTEIGLANFKFGQQTVMQGHGLVVRKLAECGLSGCRVAVGSVGDDGLTFAVSANGGNLAFHVPVKIQSGTCLAPEVILCNGGLQTFDRATITSMQRTSGFDRVASLASSPLYGIKPSELVGIVRSAMTEGNLSKAEDALNVLAASDDDRAYGIAMAVFAAGLKPGDTATETSRCSRPIKTANSQYEICSHTGLPLHKVYQDVHGNCSPRYRQSMSDSQEGGILGNHKIFV